MGPISIIIFVQIKWTITYVMKIFELSPHIDNSCTIKFIHWTHDNNKNIDDYISPRRLGLAVHFPLYPTKYLLILQILLPRMSSWQKSPYDFLYIMYVDKIQIDNYYLQKYPLCLSNKTNIWNSSYEEKCHSPNLGNQIWSKVQRTVLIWRCRERLPLSAMMSCLCRYKDHG